jgi:hypothetical protein
MELDNLNVLAAFLAVAEERSFTRAAKRVGVSLGAGLRMRAIDRVMRVDSVVFQARAQTK